MTTNLTPPKVNDPSLKHRLMHIIAKHADRNGNGDDVFNASKIKTIKRGKERHGYDPGEDAKIYEEDLSEIVHPENREAHAKATAHLKDLRKHKRLGIEHPGLGRKVKNADIAGAEMAVERVTHANVKDLLTPRKLGEEAVTKQTPINELSKPLLGRYIKSATKNYGVTKQHAGSAGYRERPLANAKAAKRAKGISNATDRLTKEDFEAALQEAYDSGFVGAVNHHTPEGKAKIKQIQGIVKEHNKKMRAAGKHHEQLKVAAYGRLGKNNPNAAKYSPDDAKRRAAGGNYRHRPPKISPADASHVRIHVTPKSVNYQGKWA